MTLELQPIGFKQDTSEESGFRNRILRFQGSRNMTPTQTMHQRKSGKSFQHFLIGFSMKLESPEKTWGKILPAPAEMDDVFRFLSTFWSKQRLPEGGL